MCMSPEESQPNIPTPKGPEPIEKIKCSIIIADDEPSITRTLQVGLGKKYTSVETVDNGKLLLEKIQDPNYTPDVIITDKTMPEMDGVRAIQEIRKITRFENTPIILVTGDIEPSEREEVETLNVVVLDKPVTRFSLIEKIEELRKRKQEPQT